MPEASYPYDEGRRRIYVNVSDHGVTLTDHDVESPIDDREKLVERARIVLSPDAAREVALFLRFCGVTDG